MRFENEIPYDEQLNPDILTSPDTVNPDITLNSDDPHVSGNFTNTEAHAEVEQYGSHQESFSSDSTPETSVNN